MGVFLELCRVSIQVAWLLRGGRPSEWWGDHGGVDVGRRELSGSHARPWSFGWRQHHAKRCGEAYDPSKQLI